MCRIFSQIFACGNLECEMNSRLGFGEKPSAGTLSHPLIKTRMSCKETLFSPVRHKKRVTQLSNAYI